MVAKLGKIFDSFIESSLFKNKSVLQINYSPETIPHRDNQIETVASNIFLVSLLSFNK